MSTSSLFLFFLFSSFIFHKSCLPSPPFFLFSFGHLTTAQQQQSNTSNEAACLKHCIFSWCRFVAQSVEAVLILQWFIWVFLILPQEPAASVWAWLQGCANQWDFRLDFQWNKHFNECRSSILKQHFPGILFMEISGLKLSVLILTQSL